MLGSLESGSACSDRLVLIRLVENGRFSETPRLVYIRQCKRLYRDRFTVLKKVIGDPTSKASSDDEPNWLSTSKLSRNAILIAMKLSRLNRVIHRWGSIAIALPTLIVLVSGVVLQWKKQSSWIQPKTWAGTNQAPQISFPDVLAIVKSVPEAGVQSWAEIDRLDVRPSKGMLKVRCKNRWEIQLDAVTGDVLQVAYRRSDLIESVHDGSFFSDFVKLGVFLRVGDQHQ